MPVATFLDTHAAIYLAEGQVSRFGERSRSLLETDDLLVSPLVRLELAYLHECDKIGKAPDQVIGWLVAIGVIVSAEPVQAVVEAAMRMTWTRDPFDRLIAATAALREAPLVTHDAVITAHYRQAVW